jgi:hypothetical protein
VVQRREGLGDDDRATLIAQAVLGSATRCNGDAVRAEELIETALGKLTSGWGSESTDALACRLSQANNLVALHRYDEARAAAEWILEVYQSRLGATHPQTLICWVSIAIALCRQDEPRLALEAATNAADGLAGRLGQEHPYALVAQLVRASALADQDRMEEAIQLEELAADGLTSALGRAHPDTLRCHANLLLSRQRQGNTAAADRRELVIQQLGEQIGEQHPDIKLAAGGGRLLRAIDPQPF